MESENFECRIRRIINSQDDYETIGSLQNIIIELDTLPIDEEMIHRQRIKEIKNIIKGFGNSFDHKVTDNQRRALVKILHGTVLPKLNTTNPSAYYTNTHTYQSPPYIEQLSKDEFIYDFFGNLIIKLGCNTLASSITINVAELVDLLRCLCLIAEDRKKYTKLYDATMAGLKSCGWTNSGFYSEPNKAKLADILSEIVGMYFE